MAAVVLVYELFVIQGVSVSVVLQGSIVCIPREKCSSEPVDSLLFPGQTQHYTLLACLDSLFIVFLLSRLLESGLPRLGRLFRTTTKK